MSREADHSTIPRLDRGISGQGPGPAVIAAESPLQDEVRRLIAELNAVLLTLTPPEHCFHMTAEQMAGADTTVFVARIDGRAVAIGALRRHGDGVGEVKRMYTRPEAQGRGIGGAILAGIEALARREGLVRLVLETGDRHPAAWRVYERGGFTRCGPVLDYPDTTWSVFYEKAVAR
jgi:putative acetyltransferase